MASEGTKFKLEMAAGIVKDYSGRWASSDQDIILEDVLEILRRCHSVPQTFDADELSEIIADYCIAAYGPPLYDFDAAEKPAEPSMAEVLTAVEATSVDAAMRATGDPSMPPELDIPNQH